MRNRIVYSFLLLAFLIASVALYSSANAQLLDTFSLNYSPSTLSVQQGGSGQVFITVLSINNFSSPVSLSFSDAPIGVSITFDNNPVTPPPGDTASSTAFFSVDSTVPAGSYSMTLIGSSGSDVKNYDFTLQVTAAPAPGDFSISVSPSSLTVSPGGSASAVVTITSINEYSSPVTLTSSGQPSGVNVNFSPDTVTPSPGGYVNSAVTVSVSNGVPSGYYPITLTGSGSSGASAVIISHSTSIGLSVASAQDFTITVNPTSLNIQQGQTKTAVVTISALGGFSSQVGLSTSNSVPSGVQIAFAPNPTTPGTSTMSINAGASAPIGTFQLQILGTSGSLSHATTFTLTITQGTQATFSLSAPSRSITVAQGRSTTAIIIVTSIGGFLSPVNTYTTWVGSPPAGVTVTGPGTLTPPPGGSTSGPLTISATSSASVGTYVLSVVGTSGSLSNSVSITVTITQGVSSDFSISASPTAISISQGTSGSSIITILSQAGFSSAVGLTVSWLGTAPSGVTFNLPSPVTPPSNAAGTSTLSVSAAQGSSVGTYTLSVTGTSGPLTHSTSVSVQISGTSVTSSTTTSVPSTVASTTSNSTSTSTAGPKCFIATATYGSSLAPQVQFLRNLRDAYIMKTYVGWNFMIAFNAWYYSFSPTVAQSITQHSMLQYTMRFVLYPLIAILGVGSIPFSLLPAHSELAAVISGLLITSLIGVAYLCLPLTALSLYSRKLRLISNRIQRILAVVLAMSLAGIVIAEAGTLGPLMILSTVTTAMSTLLLSGLITSGALLRAASRFNR